MSKVFGDKSMWQQLQRRRVILDLILFYVLNYIDNIIVYNVYKTFIIDNYSCFRLVFQVSHHNLNRSHT